IIKEEKKRAKVKYTVHAHEPYIVDSITTDIPSHDVDSIYEAHKKASFVVPGKKFKTLDFNQERERLTTLFRNTGLYHFEEGHISFIADTVNTEHKVNVELVISNRDMSRNDSLIYIPFKMHTISEVNVVTDYTFSKRGQPVLHKEEHEKVNIYSFDKPKFNPETITDAVFIKVGDLYKDQNRSLTYNRLNELRMFNYPDIQFIDDPRDTTETKLIANILLTPKKKFDLTFNLEAYRSNIQDFGIGFGPSFLVRNLFGGAEILEISARGSIGNSSDAAKNETRFFNINEVGADLKLTLPKIAFPGNLDKIIPKYMSPFTTIRAGMSSQKNIGLDKRNITGAFSYRWEPSKKLTHYMDLVDVQFVRNLNVQNYFNIYRNSFSRLNEIAMENSSQIPSNYFDPETGDLTIPEGTENFISDIKNNENLGLNPEELRDARNVIERKDRLSENNLILASNFSYIWNTASSLYDLEFTRFRGKIEFAGNTLSLLSPLLNLEKNKSEKYELSGVQFSQYAKLELGIVKHWNLGHQNVLATRAFGGIAIPYGNSNSIPFSRSFFAGGANDNRGWQAYDLGPGSTGGINEFNEANFKLAFNAEHRFNLFGQLFGAFFVDVGNIWHVFDNVEDEASTFTKFSDLADLSVGSGFGFRYDVQFFVIRIDVGFKTYSPANDDQKWFRDYNFGNAVYHFGINYPF
ncbi:MAG TPA: BamA/TamA family outer membrane protein, partial [Flavobacteriaceae bacterium]|nr:BamA/TamA family outer membrane protein [Flavobacteriaceae bacterium]